MVLSVAGLAITAFILAPNLLFAALPPKNIPQGLKDAGPIFTALERFGQGACVISLVAFNGDGQLQYTSIWFSLMAICIAVYYGLWIRYFTGGREFRLAFEPLGFIPIPMAVFPVAAFGLAAAWERSLWLGISAAVLAVGHLANSWHTYIHIKRQG